MPNVGQKQQPKPYKRFEKKVKETDGRTFTVLRDDRVVQGTPKEAVNKTNKRDFDDHKQYVNREKKDDKKPHGDDTRYMRYSKKVKKYDI